MLASVNSISLSLACKFTRPYLLMPKNGLDIVDTFYSALSAQQLMNLKDIQNSTGSSFADYKISITTFGGRGRIDIAPATLGVLAGVDLIKTFEDLNVIVEHFSLCEETLTTVVPEITIGERHLLANLWIDCEGGSEAAQAFLRERGEAAFKMSRESFGGYEKEFTIQVVLLNSEAGHRYLMTLQRSHLEIGHLYAQFEASYTRLEPLQSVSDHFNAAKNAFLELAREIGLRVQEK